jgi:hypothetical protein
MVPAKRVLDLFKELLHVLAVSCHSGDNVCVTKGVVSRIDR